MIKPLRITHRRVWLTIAALLPAAIIYSWMIIPEAEPVTILQKPAHQLLPVIVAKNESLQHCIYIRSDAGNKEWQVEWKNKLPLTVPSAVIYQTGGRHTNIYKARLVGRIESKGNYVFPLQQDPAWHKELNLVIYDLIHEKVINSFNFKIL